MNVKKYQSIFILALFAFISSGCDSFYRNMPFVSIPAQTISGSVVIGSEWIEIVPPSPLEMIANSQWVNLGFRGYTSKGSFSDSEGKTLNLADGRSTRIDAILYDKHGGSYELKISGVGNGVILTKKGKLTITDGIPDYSELRFPIDRTYTKLKIRSEIPLECDKIEWIGSKPK